ncbi:hypothetical protein [Paenibacillus sp. NPDC058071]|uniref:hypothetical protein n=1 Tax=Paenibacillus sp. NPDC058071 TaxID=3346326 RepID=UPI0036D81A50
MQKWTIRNSFFSWTPISLFILCALMMYLIVQQYSKGGFTAVIYIAVFGLAVNLTLLVFSIVKIAFNKPSDLLLQSGALSVRDNDFKPEAIQAIYVSGYFYPVVGIKPRGKRIVPMDLAFRFAGDSDEPIAALRSWAERHQVKFSTSTFWRWL